MHLLVVISPHGYGHTAQIAPVVNALARRLPGLRVTLRTTVADRVLAARFDMRFDQLREAADFGLLMSSPVDVRIEESAAEYARFHEGWQSKVAREAERLAKLSPDLVLCDVPYLPLAGAARAGLRCAALSSLNWADLYDHYCAGRPESPRILAEILAAYQCADVFVQPEPSMPMQRLGNRHAVGPIARIGHDRRHDILQRLNLPVSQRLVIVAPGGIPARWPIERWPHLEGVSWVVQEDWGVQHPAAVALEPLLDGLDMTFPDLLRSCDVLIGKPGYGTVTECACNGIPMLYVPRDDWPEEPILLEWLHRHGRAADVSRELLEAGAVAPFLDQVLALAPLPRPLPSGSEQAAEVLQALLPRA